MIQNKADHMKWNIDWHLPLGHQLKWDVDTNERKELKEFQKSALPNQDRRHFSSRLELKDEEYDSSWTIHIER